MCKLPFTISVMAIGSILAGPAQASTVLDGTHLSLWWSLPFAALLLSLALCPVFLPQLWHHHYGKIGALWASFIVGGLYNHTSFESTNLILLETLFHHYIPFICLIAALYIISGGIAIHVKASPTPYVNLTFLMLGTFLASLIGTTGAAMLLVRPLLAINQHRKYKVHTLVFFIFLVCNIGGSLTPLGDPPLFLGFLNGVSFFWVTEHLLIPLLIIAAPLLLIYGILDSIYFKNEDVLTLPGKTALKVSLTGVIHFAFLGMVVLLVLLSAIWHPGVSLRIGEMNIALENVVRDLGLIVISCISLKSGTQQARAYNEFSWAPLLEVAKLFAAIFIAAIPVIAILQAGEKGALHGLISIVNHNGMPLPAAYFWLTGILSAFLDNAPTYLIFFNTAGGHAPTLMSETALTLTAISAGAVFMGALSYIGNAPNFMVKAIAESKHVSMPGFFGYLLWSVTILVPLFIGLTYIIF